MATDGRKYVRGLRSTLGATVVIVSLGGGWILLVAGMKAHELIMGLVSVSASAFFLCQVKRAETLKLRFGAADVAAGWRVPGYLAMDIWVITKVLVLDLLRIERAGSHYRVWSFETSKENPVQAARRVLATMYTSATPNSIVLGIDFNQQLILIHQMQRSKLTAMESELGARPFEETGDAPRAWVPRSGSRQ